MMRRRMMMRRPVANVARVAVGTAVIAGTAGAVHHHQLKKWANQQAQQQSQYDQAYQQGVMDAQGQQQQYAPPPQYAAPVQAAPAQDDLAARLEHLGQLHTAGVLTDAEFAAAKEKLLAS
jgi:hypothetical protein